MIDEDDRPRKPGQPHQIGMALDFLSVGELEERIEALRAEIARLELALKARGSSRSAAEAVFKLS